MSYDLMFQKAIELQNSGALNEAESIYLRMLQAMPQNSDVWNLLGLIAQSRGDHLRAVDCFLSAIKYAPTPFAAHFFNLGLSFKSLDKSAEAKDALQRAMALMPKLKEGWNLLGLLQAETGDTQEAVKSFCKALDIDNGYPEARANLCFYTNDLETLTQLADEDKNDFYANYKAGLSAQTSEKKEHYLRRAVTAAPERTDALLALADLLRQKERFENALTYYHKVLNLNKNDLQAILGAADIYLAQGKLEKAEQLYLQSFEITTEISGAHLNYGTLLYQQNKRSEALEQYRQAVALNPDSAEISYNLALILKETGDYEEALGLMFNAHLKAPENHIFAINIAETLSDLFSKNAELALKIAENWQKQEPDNIFSQRVFAGVSGVDNVLDDKAYVKELFDAFADSYDQTITKLNPQIIHKFRELNKDIKGKFLDLGCGTGLAAEALKNDDTAFDGVDISEQMIALAEKKKLYRKLYAQDILAFLQQNPPQKQYDMILAFDVFCYMGDLREILTLLQGCNIWFSIESADEERGKDYYLMPNGRYKHSPDYIKKTLEAVGFEHVSAYPLVLRQENGEDVCGFLFNAR